jgi:hypothetical protein
VILYLISSCNTKIGDKESAGSRGIYVRSSEFPCWLVVTTYALAAVAGGLLSYEVRMSYWWKAAAPPQKARHQGQTRLV